MSNPDLERRDYNVNDIGDDDYRLVESKNDCVYFHVIGFVATLLAIIVSYTFGTKDPSGMSYFLGFPSWVVAVVAIYLVMLVLAFTRLAKWKMFPLTAKTSEEEAKK